MGALSRHPWGRGAGAAPLGDNAAPLDCPLDIHRASEGVGRVTWGEVGVTDPVIPTVGAWVWAQGRVHVAYGGADFEQFLGRLSSSRPGLEEEHTPAVGCEVAAAWPPGGCAE